MPKPTALLCRATLPEPNSFGQSDVLHLTASCRAREVLDSVTLIETTTEIFEDAGLLDPTILRTLDAVHIAAALVLGDDLEGMVTYDDRMAEAARANGIAVVAPA